jgi:hypothetical protein
MPKEEVEIISGFQIETCPKCGSLPTAHESESDCIRTLKLKIEGLQRKVKSLEPPTGESNGR